MRVPISPGWNPVAGEGGNARGHVFDFPCLRPIAHGPLEREHVLREVLLRQEDEVVGEVLFAYDQGAK
eukprot:4145600-Prorocentrum_lima.AAC.1